MKNNNRKARTAENSDVELKLVNLKRLNMSSCFNDEDGDDFITDCLQYYELPKLEVLIFDSNYLS